jgi:LPS-assembly protein
VEVIPGRRVRLEGAALTVGRTRLFSLPRLDIPLTPGAERYLPEIGQSADEGYFIKTRTAFDAPGLRDTDALIDLMSRLGLGLGLQGAYSEGRAAGDLRLYTILGPQPGSRASLDHRDRIGQSDVTFSGLYQQNNYLTSPGQSSLQLRGQASIPTQDGSTRLTGFRTSSDRPSFSTVSQNLAVFDSRRLGEISTSAQVAWSQATTRTTAAAAKQEQVDLRLEAAQQMRAFGAKLEYQRAVPIESQAGFFGSSDRTPVLTLNSDTDRLGLGRSLPFRSNLQASIGEFADPASRKRVGRMYLDNDARGSLRPIPKADLNWFSRYRQGVYSDDTAQFAIDYGASLRYALGSGPRPAFSLDMNYMRMHSRGFTPLSIDRAGRSDALSVGMGWRPQESLSFGLQTGYDWQQAERGSSPWQQVSLRSEWAPEPGLLVRAQTIYDTFSTVWGSSRLEAAFPLLGGQATIGAQYDGRRSVWSGLTASLAGWRTGQMDISFLADYNGYRERLDSCRARVIYDLHCTDAIFEIIDDSVGFRSGRTISLTIGLKGFPSGSPFGVGTRGQAVGFGGGAGF